MNGDGDSSATSQQTIIASFLEFSVGQNEDTARELLQATGWKLEEAIQRFYLENDFDDASSPPYIPPQENEVFIPDKNPGFAENHMGLENIIGNDGSEVRAPLPVKTDVLYDSPFFYSFEPDLNCLGVWGADQGSTSAAETSGNNLISMYSPPLGLMYHGPFEMAKEAASAQDRWLLVNVQSTWEFSSHMLNRDTWGNKIVAQTVTSSFIFWQICNDTEEGSKIITYYKLDSVPTTLVIDPITGKKMHLWRGMIEPESFLEDVLQFTDSSPSDHLFSVSHRRPRERSHASPLEIQDEPNEDDDEIKRAQALSMGALEDVSEGFSKDSGVINEVLKTEKHNYPPLPEEPKGDKSLLCRVGVRLPDGSRVQRNFLRSDPIQLMWSFCAAKCGDEKPFRLTHAIPGDVKNMDYDSLLTFDESGVSNSMISVTWE